MITIYLLRHGETAWNADNNRYCGRTDIALTEAGLTQAKNVKDQLNGINFKGVYSSPLKRARDTAFLATGREVVIDQRLIEMDFGQWERLTRTEFIAKNPEVWEKWIDDPATARAGETGETGLEVVTRVDNFFNELISTNNAGNFLVVAHNAVNRLFLSYKLGMPLKHYRKLVQLNSAVTQFTLDEDSELTLHYLNSILKQNL